MDAAIAALIGAGIGAVASLGGAWLQQHYQSRRDFARVAADLAIADFNHALDLAKTQTPMGSTARIPPMSIFVAYHADVLRAVADGSFDDAALKAIDERQIALLKALHWQRGQPS